MRMFAPTPTSCNSYQLKNTRRIINQNLIAPLPVPSDPSKSWMWTSYLPANNKHTSIDAICVIICQTDTIENTGYPSLIMGQITTNGSSRNQRRTKEDRGLPRQTYGKRRQAHSCRRVQYSWWDLRYWWDIKLVGFKKLRKEIATHKFGTTF